MEFTAFPQRKISLDCAKIFRNRFSHACVGDISRNERESISTGPQLRRPVEILRIPAFAAVGLRCSWLRFIGTSKIKNADWIVRKEKTIGLDQDCGSFDAQAIFRDGVVRQQARAIFIEVY